MKKKQAIRERIFKNNKVVLNFEERHQFAEDELKRQSDSKYQTIDNVDICDPYTSILYNCFGASFGVLGYSKRMPNDVPNDRIAIQVAVSRLIKRLKEN